MRRPAPGVAVLVLLLAAGCNPALPVTVRVVPDSAELAPRQAQTFSVDVDGSFGSAVTWTLVEGPGTLEAGGVFRAPDRVPPAAENRVVVRATLASGESGDAILRIVPLPLEPLRGTTAGGTDVTITGPGVHAAARVFFDGIESPSVVLESTFAIRARTPPGVLGRADVRIEGPDGTVVEYPGAFGYGAAVMRAGQWQGMPGLCNGDYQPLDVDVDGDDDVVVNCAYYFDVWINDGSGFFGESVRIDVQTYEGAFRVADRDADGDLDLFLANTFSVLGAVWDATPSGLVLATAVPAGAGLIVRDVDGDDRADLLDRDRVRFALPGGGFGAPLVFALTGTTAYFPTSADLDEDGLPEVIVGSSVGTAGQIVIYPNLGGGTFGAPGLIPVTVTFNQLSFDSGDYNGDGFQDLVVARGSPSVSWLAGMGNGTLGPLLPTSTSTNGIPHSEDVDGDGYDDLVYHGAVTWGSPSGLAGPGVLLSNVPSSYPVRLAKLDSSGFRAVVGKESSNATLAFASGPRQWGPVGLVIAPPSLLADVAVNGASDVFVSRKADIDGNGALLLLAPDLQVVDEVLLQDGSVQEIRVGDVDLDGVGDILGTDALGALWVVGRDETGLGDPQRIAFDGAVVDAAAGDLDGDGQAEIVVVVEDTATSFARIDVLWGTGSRQILEDGTRPTAVVIADLDLDGTPEVVACDEEGARLLVFALDTSRLEGGLELVVEVPSGTRPNRVRAIDLDGDSFPELIAQSITFGGGGVIEYSVWAGSSTLTFESPRRFRNSGYSEWMDVADLDGDGNIDILYAAFTTDGMNVLRGTGAGAFLDPVFVPRRSSFARLALLPATGDTADLVAIEPASGRIVILENESR